MSELTILVVEDNVQSRERLIALLTKFGYTKLLSVADSAGAIESISLQPVDLILMDIELENSTLNGVELAEWVNDNHDIPIIYITGNTDVDIIADVATTQHQEFITKPYTPQQLHASISLAFIKHRSTEANESKLTFKKDRYIFFKQSKKYRKLFIPSIIFVEADDKILWIHTAEQSVSLTTSSLTGFQSRNYSENILRIHNKYSVNIDKIIGFDLAAHEVTLMHHGREKILPVGRMYRKELYSRLERF